ncbi:MAG: helix-turn-helix domain-containing protein [Oscillibacter sp.]|nr:helix-turn-helix domain-containing protein [Oscillibacter sp.]
MTYQAELEYLQNVLGKLHIETKILKQGEIPAHPLEFSFREGDWENTWKAAQETRWWAGENAVYKVEDPFRCNYIFMILPDMPQTTGFLIGPYFLERLTEKQLLEEAERQGVPVRLFTQLIRHYHDIPFLQDQSVIGALVIAFAEKVWGSGEAYEIVDINRDMTHGFTPLQRVRELTAAEEMVINMRSMELRYDYENELMRTVSRGLIHRAEQMMANMNQMHLQRRGEDPLRSMKNYCIICNTLMRKAAEQGGVHPVYLDSVSTEFAHRIEHTESVEGAGKLMQEMVQSYCRLVKKHSMNHYSSVIQRTITYIDADLSGDLRLRNLAAAQNVNASYLSSLFKKETGETITEHVNRKRMEHALHLLQTTKLQVQSIAQYCGISDLNYFSKLFKKQMGMTPREYRAAFGNNQ